MIIDAGPVNSPVLLSVGLPGLGGSASNPDVIADVYFRVGGGRDHTRCRRPSAWSTTPRTRSSTTCGPWRADHGNAVGWTQNTGATGLVVTGSGVTAYGLAVEHTRRTRCSGAAKGGTDIFYQTRTAL